LETLSFEDSPGTPRRFYGYGAFFPTFRTCFGASATRVRKQ
jgi:hypothetical protein